MEIIPADFFLMDLCQKYLPKTGRCIELGCAPGTFLAALAKNFNYELTGIDMVGLDQTRETLRYNGIENVTLIEGDIFRYDPAQAYDIVFSYGLIEHWPDPTVPFRQFDKFCRKGGYMFMGLPNFRYLFRMIHRLFGSGLYHNYNIMDLRAVAGIVQGYKVIYLDYYPRLYHYNFFIKTRFTAPSIVFIGQKT